MATFEIYFRDLNEDAQKRLLEELKTKEEDENWETIPLAIFEREEEEENTSENTGLLPGYISPEQETPANGETVFILTSLGRTLIARYENLVSNSLWEVDEFQEGEQVVGWKRDK